MDAFSSFALTVALAVAGFYVLYLVIRSAVAAGITDAQRRTAKQEEERPAGD